MLYRALLFTFLPTSLELAFVCSLLAAKFSAVVAGLVGATFVAYVAWTLKLTQVRRLAARLPGGAPPNSPAGPAEGPQSPPPAQWRRFLACPARRLPPAVRPRPPPPPPPPPPPGRRQPAQGGQPARQPDHQQGGGRAAQLRDRGAVQQPAPGGGGGAGLGRLPRSQLLWCAECGPVDGPMGHWLSSSLAARCHAPRCPMAAHRPALCVTSL
jgi:hypothetical protein